MREIKFRVYCPLNNRWYFSDKNELILFKDLEEEDHWKVMQYTGLKDKNGKEIYEGDVIDQKYKYEVRFSTGSWLAKKGDSQDYLLHVFMRKRARAGSPVEIIGNIYTNPELLK